MAFDIPDESGPDIGVEHDSAVGMFSFGQIQLSASSGFANQTDPAKKNSTVTALNSFGMSSDATYLG